jgi:hypothetical protein
MFSDGAAALLEVRPVWFVAEFGCPRMKLPPFAA